MNKKLKNEKGITLIALIVAIIILILLAAISIRAVYDMEILKIATHGTENYVKSAKNENKILDDTDQKINEIIRTIKTKEKNEKARVAGIYEAGTPNLLISWEDLKDSNKMEELRTEKNLLVEFELENGAWWLEYSIQGEIEDKYKNIDIIVSDEISTSIGVGCYDTEYVYLYFPDNITIDEGWLGGEVEGLTKIHWPAATTTIWSYCFEECGSLQEIIISEGVTTIGDGAFAECIGLTSVTIPNSVITIGNGAFSGCTGLESVVIPNSVTTIGDDAFSECTGLKSVVIPNSVTTIGNYAFAECTGLTSVTIPNSVVSMGKGIFEYYVDGDTLESINVRGYSSKPAGWDDNWHGKTPALRGDGYTAWHNVVWGYTGE